MFGRKNMPKVDPSVLQKATLDDVLKALKTLRKLGPIGMMAMKKMPMMKGLPAGALDAKKLRTFEDALDSLTPEERKTGRVSKERVKEVAKANNLKDREVKGILDFFKAMKSNNGGKYGIKN